ncbi:MAG: response regulator [Gammaproteobacteria bacterium]|nr:response regulator [Gammaproteobacteria bacterium]
MRILLVEDDSLLGEGLHVGLQRENYTVDWVKNGETALSAVRETDYDSIILDIGLPKMNGLQVLKSMRSQGSNIPVLILTAQDGLAERVAGLDTGADDYLVKPFEFDELCARLRALVRRSRGLPNQQITYRNITIDPAAHAVTLDGETVDLSRREFSLLETLLSSVGWVLSRTQLEDKLYSWGDEIESNTIEVHIHHLRKRFGADLIKTVRGIGYTIPRDER